MDVDGMTCWLSRYDIAETMLRLRTAIAQHGMTVFAHIDHGGAAAQAGLELAPMELLLFGNPKAGTPLMQKAPTAGIDLPLRALVWTDREGSTWFAFNDPGWIAARHGARAGNEQVLATMRKALAAIAEEAIQPPLGAGE